MMENRHPVSLRRMVPWWLMGAVLVGCQRSDSLSVLLPEAVDVPRGQSLSGTIRFEGMPPVLPPLPEPAPGDAACHQGNPILDERFVLSADGGLAGVVVEVMGQSPAKDPDAVEIDQHQCRFQPHVAVGQAGASLLVKNSDPVFHNVRVARHKTGTLKGGENLRNLGQLPLSPPVDPALGEPGVYRLECDVHRWMSSFLYLASSSHVAVSDEQGNFTVNRALPDGSYTVRIWHPLMRDFQTTEILVSGGKSSLQATFGSGDFQFSGSPTLN